MKDAQIFYSDLLYQNACEKNEDIRDRLAEMPAWRNAFINLLKNRSDFRFVIHKKSKEFWKEILTRHDFSNELIQEVTKKMS